MHGYVYCEVFLQAFSGSTVSLNMYRSSRACRVLLYTADCFSIQCRPRLSNSQFRIQTQSSLTYDFSCRNVMQVQLSKGPPEVLGMWPHGCDWLYVWLWKPLLSGPEGLQILTTLLTCPLCSDPSADGLHTALRVWREDQPGHQLYVGDDGVPNGHDGKPAAHADHPHRRWATTPKTWGTEKLK